MATISTRARTTRRVVLVGEDFLAVPSVAVPSAAWSLIVRSSSPPRSRPKHRPVTRSRQGAGYRETILVVPARSPGR